MTTRSTSSGVADQETDQAQVQTVSLPEALALAKGQSGAAVSTPEALSQAQQAAGPRPAIAQQPAASRPAEERPQDATGAATEEDGDRKADPLPSGDPSPSETPDERMRTLLGPFLRKEPGKDEGSEGKKAEDSTKAAHELTDAEIKAMGLRPRAEARFRELTERVKQAEDWREAGEAVSDYERRGLSRLDLDEALEASLQLRTNPARAIPAEIARLQAMADRMGITLQRSATAPAAPDRSQALPQDLQDQVDLGLNEAEARMIFQARQAKQGQQPQQPRDDRGRYQAPADAAEERTRLAVVSELVLDGVPPKEVQAHIANNLRPILADLCRDLDPRETSPETDRLLFRSAQAIWKRQQKTDTPRTTKGPARPAQRGNGGPTDQPAPTGTEGKLRSMGFFRSRN